MGDKSPKNKTRKQQQKTEKEARAHAAPPAPQASKNGAVAAPNKKEK